jgi:23S rRNA pseudouridine955/2504/2580 synthase
MKVEFQAGSDDDGRRFESVLRKLLPHQPLASLHKALRQGDVRLNGAKAAADARVRALDKIAVWDGLLNAPSPAAAAGAETPSVSALPSGWIVYEGTDLLVVDKPSGLLVHRGEGHRKADAPLDERVRVWLAPSTAPSLSFRPGPLHRLDRETSGLVVFSKTLLGARSFSEALAHRLVTKVYLAVLRGHLDGPREVSDALSRDSATGTSSVDAEGEAALTRFRPLAQASGLTLAEVDLGSGRTHQIRVHAQSLGLPLAGDTKYGGGPTPPGLDVPWLLHAWRLACDLLPPLTAALPAPRAAWVEKQFKIPL